MNMLPIELRVKQLKLNLVYYVINDRAPRYLSNFINVSRKQHGISTLVVIYDLIFIYCYLFLFCISIIYFLVKNDRIFRNDL